MTIYFSYGTHMEYVIALRAQKLLKACGIDSCVPARVTRLVLKPIEGKDKRDIERADIFFIMTSARPYPEPIKSEMKCRHDQYGNHWNGVIGICNHYWLLDDMHGPWLVEPTGNIVKAGELMEHTTLLDLDWDRRRQLLAVFYTVKALMMLHTLTIKGEKKRGTDTPRKR